MTVIYKPVLIESAEQAETLPVGTVAIDLARRTGECPTCHGDVHVDMAGAIWTTTNEPTDAECVAVLDVKYGGPVGPYDEPYDAEEMAEARAALSAARAARRDKEKR